MYEGLPNEEIHPSYQSFIYVCAIKFSYGKSIVFVTKLNKALCFFILFSIDVSNFAQESRKAEFVSSLFLTNSTLA